LDAPRCEKRESKMKRKVRHTILLVDDNDDDVELTRRAFDKSGVPNQLD
jgi:hypothetical protein